MKYQEVEGDLIILAKQGTFNVIAHGVNCFNRQKKGIAPQMAAAFGTATYPLELGGTGDINKLGQIDAQERILDLGRVWVVNCYTQHKIKKFSDVDYPYTTTDNPFDYQAFALCMRKINYRFKGATVGMPMIGAHLAGGSWELIKPIIQKELKDCFVTVVIYKP